MCINSLKSKTTHKPDARCNIATMPLLPLTAPVTLHACVPASCPPHITANTAAQQGAAAPKKHNGHECTTQSKHNTHSSTKLACIQAHPQPHNTTSDSLVVVQAPQQHVCRRLGQPSATSTVWHTHIRLRSSSAELTRQVRPTMLAQTAGQASEGACQCRSQSKNE